MTKQQLREAIRKIIRQELNEEKTVPNPNKGKWRIVGIESGNPLTKEFYSSKEEAQAASRKLRTKESGMKIIQLKDTMKMSENAPAETKPKPGVKEKEPPTEKPGKRREFVPKPGADPRPKAKTKATMKEAEMLKQVIKRFKSKKMNEEAEQKYSYGTTQPHKDQGDYTIIIKAYPDPNGRSTKEQLMAMVDKYKNDEKAPMQIKFFKSKQEAGK